MNRTKIYKNLTALAAGTLVAFLLLEIFLRIFNPIPYHVKGDRIVLPTNQKLNTVNPDAPFFTKEFTHTVNSIGFRGQEPPKDGLKNYLSIITVGGSTTRNARLADDETWTHVLGERLKQDFKDVWVNNGGLDGTSTFGHILLLEDYIVRLRPRIVIFLIGANDVVKKPDKFYDRLLQDNSLTWKNLLKKSEVITYAINFSRAYQARRKGLNDPALYIWDTRRHFELSEEERETLLEKYTGDFGPYIDRLQRLIRISRENGIEPIFITQPTLVGDLKDPETGLDLATIEAVDGMNGSLYWQVLREFNATTMDVAEKNGVFAIDLGAKLPKSTQYQWDALHFTIPGGGGRLPN